MTPSSEPPEAIADTVFGTWPSFKERCKVGSSHVMLSHA